MNPERVRVNMRYRGPRESLKASQVLTQSMVNLQMVEKQLEGIAGRMMDHRYNLYHGVKPSPIEEPMDVRMKLLSKRIDNLERGVYHG